MTAPVLLSETLNPGQGWSRVIPRGQVLRLTDTVGTAAVALFAYRASDPLERYNMPDTLKAQYTAYLSAGRVLFSDMGHVLLSVIADTCGWHDTLSGHQDAGESLAKYGPGTYQQLRNARHRNTRDNVLVELAKHGLGRRDLHANINCFVRIAADGDGRLRFVSGNSRPGAHIDLRAELDVLVVLSNTPHPLDPSPVYAPPPVGLTIWQAPPVAADDHCRIGRLETVRGFAKTEALA